MIGTEIVVQWVELSPVMLMAAHNAVQVQVPVALFPTQAPADANGKAMEEFPRCLSFCKQ